MAKPKRADDKRRSFHNPKVEDSDSNNGVSKRIGGVVHDRRLGKGKRAS